jgi:hypothetical protein
MQKKPTAHRGRQLAKQSLVKKSSEIKFGQIYLAIVREKTRRDRRRLFHSAYRSKIGKNKIRQCFEKQLNVS